MIGELLLGIFGNAVYDLAKKVSFASVDSEDNEIARAVYEAMERATTAFNNKYDDQFGKPDQSFLARRENWEIVGRSLSFSSDALKASALNPEGYDDARSATPEALEYLVQELDREMRKSRRLEKLIVEKEAVTRLERMEKLLTSFVGPEAKNVMSVVDPGRGGRFKPELNKLYKSKLDNGSEIRYVIRKDGASVEFVYPDGAILYCDLDNDGNVREYKNPYPLEQYALVLDQNDVVRAEETPMPDNRKELKAVLKWGRSVHAIFNEKGQIIHITVNGGSHWDHVNRKIIPMPPAPPGTPSN